MKVSFGSVDALGVFHGVDLRQLKALINTAAVAALVYFFDHFEGDRVHGVDVLLDGVARAFASAFAVGVLHERFEEFEVVFFL